MQENDIDLNEYFDGSNGEQEVGDELSEKAKRSFVYKAKIDKPIKVHPLVWSAIITLLNGILAGAVVSIAAAAYLRVENIYGSVIFVIGFLVVFFYGFSFFTNKAGYCLNQNAKQNIMLLPTWVGNMLGALLVGNMITLTRDDVYDLIYKRSNQLCGYTLSDSSGGILILSIFCGVVMFIAADNYKNGKNNAQKFITVILCVMVMTVCRFEHSIISVFYFTVADAWTDKSVWYMIIMAVGNALGCVLIPACHMGIKKIREYAKNNV